MASTVFDKLLRASFDGIEFPWTEVDVSGAIREHEHEYPHAPGAALEKLGRKLYEVRFKCSFHETFRKYPKLWSQSLPRLVKLFESEETKDLVIPNVGTIRACCVKWSRSLVAPKRSGETVDLTFREDQEQAFLVNKLLTVSTQSLSSTAQKFAIEAAKIKPKESLFDSIQASVNSVLAIVDTAQSYGNLIESKLLAVAGMCDDADRRLKVLNDPLNHELLDALLTLWDSILGLQTDLAKTGGVMLTYTLQRGMSLIELSKALYDGDGSRAVELLQLNAIVDPFDLPQSTQIRYYAAA